MPELQKYLHTESKRLIDRDFKPNLKQDLDDEIDDEPNSKMKLQAQLNDLYMGP